MAKPLLVPGTQASSLVRGDDEIYSAVRMGLPLIPKSLGGVPKDQWVEVMSMKHAPGKLAPARTTLQDGSEVKCGKVSKAAYSLLKYEGWPYDWRADLRWNAKRLVADLAQRLVSKVALVGAPLAGTMNALEALLPGSTGLGAENRLLAREMAWTWPALYQMLPSWQCVEDAHGEPRPDEDQILQESGWPEKSGIQADLLERARKTQARLKDPFAKFGKVEARSFMASGHKTAQELVRKGKEEGKFIFDKKSGDTLVPFSRTLAWGDDAFNDSVREFRSKVQNHARLCVDGTVTKSVLRFLRD